MAMKDITDLQVVRAVQQGRTTETGLGPTKRSREKRGSRKRCASARWSAQTGAAISNTA
jgi:hypothetical protein